MKEEIYRQEPPRDARLNLLLGAGLVVGLLGLVASIAGLLSGAAERFFQSYLVAFLFWGGLSMGALVYYVLHSLTSGNWGFAIRRALEAASKTLWLSALLFLPVLLGLRYLYPWARPGVVAADPLLQHKAPYLNIPFFIVRAVLYFAIMAVVLFFLARWGQDPLALTDPVLRRRTQRVSALGIIAISLALTFASIDWVMSLQPAWTSTIFGMLFIIIQALGGLALGIFLLPLLVEAPPLLGFTTPRTVRDLGAMLLTTVVLWAYLSFAQYLIIWQANLPHEVTWYLARSSPSWTILFIVVIVFQFAVPFAFLISLTAKRNMRLIAGLSLAILLMRWLETYWFVMPAFYPQGIVPHWLDLATMACAGGIWLAVFSWHLRRTPVGPLPLVKEPEGVESEGRQPSA